MLEDQVAPKQCGHVLNKKVVPLGQAVARIRAACDARDEYAALYGQSGPLILARTDARQCDGLQAAIERCLAFVEAGADMTFLEAPQTVAEMEEYCRRVPGPKLANMLEQGRTPILSPPELKAMGYTAHLVVGVHSSHANVIATNLRRHAHGRYHCYVCRNQGRGGIYPVRSRRRTISRR
jgi:2-methylisocitrate lyase-like PEP mutase family enzyme